MRNMLLGTVAGLVVMVPGTASAVDYVPSPPISQIVTDGPRDCQVSGRVTMPVIAWGADMVTIHANGDAETTQSGSFFDQAGLNYEIKREDDVTEQLRAVLRCDTPYFRGTVGMVSMVAPVTQADPRTELVVIYQHSWSAGGDALVAKQGIKRPEDLRGKTIAIQRYGPHVGYLAKLLADAGIALSDVNIKWTEQLTAHPSSPAEALRNDPKVDAAFVIIPDALALTSGGAVGTGAEDSVRDATIVQSTKSAPRIISDVIAVRRDYFDANRDRVQALVSSLLKAEEQLRAIMKNSSDSRRAALLPVSAKILLDDRALTEDAAAMWADAETAGWRGNVRFFTEQGYRRNFSRLAEEIHAAFRTINLVDAPYALSDAAWDYAVLSAGLSNLDTSVIERFDRGAVERALQRARAQGTIDDATQFQFEIHFKPNQRTFSIDLYLAEFERVVELASTYAGSVLTVEGHSDPMNYLRKEKSGARKDELKAIAQAARNLSISRANAVRDAVIELANETKAFLDPSQFSTAGFGITQPKHPIPQSQQEWLGNMRVVFRIVSVEAESEVFRPL